MLTLLSILGLALLLLTLYMVIRGAGAFIYLFVIFFPLSAIVVSATAVMNIFKAISMESEFSENTTQLRMNNEEIKRKYSRSIKWTSLTAVVVLISAFFMADAKVKLSAIWALIPFAVCILTCIMLSKYNKRVASKLAQAKKTDDIEAARKKAKEDEEKASKGQTYGEYLQEKEKQKQEAREEKQRQKQEKQERKAAAEAEEKRQAKETREKAAKAVGNAVTAVGNTATKAASSVANSRVVKSVQDSVVESIEDKRDERHLKSQIKQANMIIDGQQQVNQKAIESKGQLALVDSTATDDEFRSKAAKLGVKVDDKSVEEIAQQVLALSSQAAIDALPDGLDDVTKAKYILDGRV